MSVTPIIDDATRANEDPLSNGGLWSGNTPIIPGDFRSILSTNTIVSAGASNGSSYTPVARGPDVEMYVVASGTLFGPAIFLRVNDPNTVNVHGYDVTFNANADTIDIKRWDSSTVTVTLASLSFAYVPTQKMGVTAIGNVITAYIDDVAKLSVVDDAYQNAGAMGIRQFASQSPITSVGGGTIGSQPKRDYARFPKVLLAR